jgi:hypothetical protein
VLLGVLDERLDAAAALDVRVADDLVAGEAAEQLVDRDVERLALDVPEGDVDGGDGRGGDVAGREEAASEHLLPEALDLERVLADEERLEVLDGAGDGKLAAGEAAFADAPDALVGVHDDEGVVALARPGRDEECFDIGDLHS